MRIDQFLRKTRLFKQREMAKELCDKGFVKINGQCAKPSKHVLVGDVIQIETTSGNKRFRIVSIPDGNVKKSEGCHYYCEVES